MRIRLSISLERETKLSLSLCRKLKQAAKTGIELAAPRAWPPLKSAEISLMFTDDRGIRELNRNYRNKDAATDVLSFPQWEDEIPPPGGPVLLGDIIISQEKAGEQAALYGHSLRRETVFLFVHGLLHLLGYDHERGEEAEKEMFALQEQIMTKIRLART